MLSVSTKQQTCLYTIPFSGNLFLFVHKSSQKQAGGVFKGSKGDVHESMDTVNYLQVLLN